MRMNEEFYTKVRQKLENTDIVVMIKGESKATWFEMGMMKADRFLEIDVHRRGKMFFTYRLSVDDEKERGIKQFVALEDLVRWIDTE